MLRRRRAGGFVHWIWSQNEGTGSRAVGPPSERCDTAAQFRSSIQASCRGYNLSILAARMKSLSVRPLILWVHVVISALPQPSRMSG